MEKNQANQLVLKSINQLFEHSFFIPAYQRGYRWTSTQVKQLLDDVWKFAVNPPQKEDGIEKPFYCLQPIVVKKHEEGWEVIDGQQRLTTIYLILKSLENLIERDQKNFTRIFFETRVDSEVFLSSVENQSAETASQNIDYYHIYNAYDTIIEWFKIKANTTEDASPRAVLAPVLLRDTKVIWYETEENGTNNSIDIFTRLNIGKIPLTNAELIKALFLQKGNFSEKETTLKQIKIASEWDLIEKTLQDDSFWFFIYNPDNPIKYDNRIEYIFDLMKERKEESEFYHTFNKFHEDFSNCIDENNKPNIEQIWQNFKKYYLVLEEWYKDYELYHYIGFLIDCGITINIIKNGFTGRAKNEFKEDFLIKEIKKQVNCNINDIVYRDNRVKKILLLFNIQTVLKTQKSYMRFPFNKYKSEKWDIEHVRSQTDKTVNGNQRIEWINDILNYFGEEIRDATVNDLLSVQPTSAENIELNEIIKSLVKMKGEVKIDNEEFEKIFKRVQKYFNEDNQTDELDSISNLALLDYATNRSYGNAFFPIKRKRIIEKDSNGIFVPIATKNLFLKYYSDSFDNVMFWNKCDAKNYLNAIKETLCDFLPKTD